MDLYNEDENIISSDEYSEDDNDEEALMNDCIKTTKKIPLHSSATSIKGQNKSEKKNKQINSLIRSQRIFIIYKKRSIKWLNNQRQRDKYKQIIRKSVYSPASLTEENSKEMKTIPENLEFSSFQNGDFSKLSHCEDEQANNQIKSKDITIQGKMKRLLCQENDEIKGENNLNHKYKEVDSAQFCNKINEMFPKYDEYINKHIEFITKSETLSSTEEKMKEILDEIRNLDCIIRTKEKEWNQLLHLKMTKEEIYCRLSRKKNILALKNTGVTTRDEKGFSRLREHEVLKNGLTITNAANYSIQQLIEKRANMKPEDLVLESKNTSRLQSLLVSQDILPNIDSPINKSWRNLTLSLNLKNPSNNFTSTINKIFKPKTLLKRPSREGFMELKAGDNIKKNSREIFQQDMKVNDRSKSSLINLEETSYPFHSSSNDISLSSKLMDSKKALCQELVHQNFVKESSNICLDNSCNILNIKRDFRNNAQINTQYPLCQECKIQESRFVCAGCGNQWYCSKICQISAWDKHSDMCPE